MTVHTAVVQLVAGLSRGGLIFIVAAGLTLIFGALRVVNLAHGSFYMVGAYITTTVVSRYGSAGFWLALLVAPAAVAVLGLVVERLIMRRVYGANHLQQILVSFASLFIFDDLTRTIYGTDPRLGLPAGGSRLVRQGAGSHRPDVQPVHHGRGGPHGVRAVRSPARHVDRHRNFVPPFVIRECSPWWASTSLRCSPACSRSDAGWPG